MSALSPETPIYVRGGLSFKRCVYEHFVRYAHSHKDVYITSPPDTPYTGAFKVKEDQSVQRVVCLHGSAGAVHVQMTPIHPRYPSGKDF